MSSCAPIFKFLYGPPGFLLGANLYQNCYFFAILAAVNPHFQGHSDESWRDCGDLGLPPDANFLKIA